MALIDLLGKIDTLKKELDGLKPVSPEREKLLWEKFRLEWNYNSNHIEGNTLTYSETQLFFLHDKTTGDHDMREYEEMRAHDAAIHLISNWADDKEREISEAEIRELNKVILVKPFWKEAITPDGQSTRRLIKVGEYKEQPNSVMLSTGKMFEYASPEETPRLMAELVDWYRASEIKNAIILAAELHYRYIRIHPFDDGNGRIARLLVNYVLMKNDFPPVIIKSAEKDKYLTALRKADAGDREAFHEYMAEQLIWSLEIAVKAGKGESIEEREDIDKKIALLEQKLQNIEQSKKKKVEQNLNIYSEMVNGWLKRLAYEWILVINKFNPLFLTHKHQIAFNGSSMPHTIIVKENNDISHYDSFFEQVIEALKNIPIDQTNCTITLFANYSNLAKVGANNIKLNNHITITIEKSNYKISSRNFSSDKWKHIDLLTKSVHEQLTQEEELNIIQTFSNSALSYINHNLKNAGL